MNVSKLSATGARILLGLAVACVLIAARGYDHLEKGYDFLRKGRYDKAEASFQKAANQFKEKGVELGLALTYEGLGDLNRARGLPQEAVELYKQSLGYYKAIPRETVTRLWTKRNDCEDEIYHQHVAAAPNRWETYDSFLAKYPDNRKAAEARQRKDTLQYTPFLAEDTLAAYVRFVDTWPKNLLVPKAMDKIFAFWQKDFGTEGDADAVADYDRFLREFPSSGLRAAAMTMRSYHAAFLADSPEVFSEFYERRKQAQIPFLAAGHLARLEKAFEQVAQRQGSATAFLILYENTGNPWYFQSAFGLVRNATEESFFARKKPYEYFKIGDASSGSQVVSQKEMLENLVERTQKEGVGGLVAAAYLPKLETTIKPSFNIPVRSLAQFGRYTLTVELRMRVKLTQRMTGLLTDIAAGLTGARTTAESTETFTTRAETTLSPGSNGMLHGEFDELVTNSQQSFVTLAGFEENRKIIDVSYTITGIRLNDSKARDWNTALVVQGGQSFKEAAQQFNALAGITRSSQIDQWEQTAREGIAAELAGREAPVQQPPR